MDGRALVVLYSSGFAKAWAPTLGASLRAAGALRQYTQRLETLQSVTAALSTSLSLDEVLQLIRIDLGYRGRRLSSSL